VRIRTFLGIELDQGMRDAIQKWIDPIKRETREFRWVKSENLHFTIRFLGDVEESKVNGIGGVLDQALSPFKAFPLSLDDVGGFPKLSYPRVLWIGIRRGFDECCKIKNAMDHALVGLGFRMESQEYVPHLTLARAKGKPSLPSAIGVNAFDSLRGMEMDVRAVTLFKSELTSSGSVYTKLHTASSSDKGNALKGESA